MASWMWIIAGPIGAGKSTFAGPYLDDLHAAFLQDTGPDGLLKLNADERMLDLRRQFPDAAQAVLNRRAAEQIDAEVVRLIADGRSFAVETVLSTPKYRDDVEAAKANEFRIGLIYVGSMKISGVLTRHPAWLGLRCHWRDPDTIVRTASEVCHREPGFGFVAADERHAASIAIAGAW